MEIDAKASIPSPNFSETGVSLCSVVTLEVEGRIITKRVCTPELPYSDIEAEIKRAPKNAKKFWTKIREWFRAKF